MQVSNKDYKHGDIKDLLNYARTLSPYLRDYLVTTHWNSWVEVSSSVCGACVVLRREEDCKCDTCCVIHYN